MKISTSHQLIVRKTIACYFKEKCEIKNTIEGKSCDIYYFAYSNKYDELSLEKDLLMNNAVIYTESINYDGDYNYYPQTILEECTYKAIKEYFSFTVYA